MFLAASCRRGCVMRLSLILLPVALLTGCAGPASPAPGVVSCQPYGYSPAPIAFTFAPGPVTSSSAEQTAVALFRSCGASAPASTISDLRSSVSSATGGPGPNAGQPVWLVQIDATSTDPGASYGSHYLVEVNQATGVPTLIAYG